MDYFQAIILGVIQGITEWLPISSQAMVFLFGRFVFDLGHIEALGLSIWLHAGTLLAAVVYFWKDIINILTGLFKKDSNEQKLFFFLILATAMSGIVAFPLLWFIFLVELPKAPFVIIVGLLFIIIAFLQKKSRQLKTNEKLLNVKDGLIVGIAQGFAALPGFSRSGSTVATFLFQKYSLKKAFYLSFLMSIPIVLLAQIALPIFKNEFIITSELLVGAITAGLVGFITIKALLQFAEKVNFFKTTLTLGIITILLGIILFF
jgi:undecaprenyl-diphosphatase